jgi:hypothetical protein
LDLGSGSAYIGFSQLTIQGMPYLSVSIPKRGAQNVSPIGIFTFPPSLSSRNIRSASFGVSTMNEAMFTGSDSPRSKAALDGLADAATRAFLAAYGGKAKGSSKTRALAGN